MSEQIHEVTITLTVMGQGIQMRCAPNEIRTLENAANYLNDKLHETCNGSQQLTIDTAVIITALNITKELITVRKQHNTLSDNISSRIVEMLDKLKLATTYS